MPLLPDQVLPLLPNHRNGQPIVQQWSLPTLFRADFAARLQRVEPLPQHALRVRPGTYRLLFDPYVLNRQFPSPLQYVVDSALELREDRTLDIDLRRIQLSGVLRLGGFQPEEEIGSVTLRIQQVETGESLLVVPELEHRYSVDPAEYELE